MRVEKSKDPAAMIQTANWIGHFHATTEANLQRTDLTFLKPYDAEYYLGWAQRTLHNAGNLHPHLNWLELLLERFDEVVSNLLPAPLTVIHGECSPKNILFRDGKIYPVDWESATMVAGEIDLASLTDMWSEEIVCKRFDLI